MTHAAPDPAAPRRNEGMLSELLADRMALFGVVVLTLLVLMAIFAPLLAPYDPAAQALRERLIPPVWQEKGTWAHLLGTDHLGRDILSRLIWGARISLTVGVAVVADLGRLRGHGRPGRRLFRRPDRFAC